MSANQLKVVVDLEKPQEGISQVYYFFRDLLAVKEDGGRTAGRKIGVAQEVVVRKLLEQSPLINERMLFERSLPGFSGATHKVEFLLYGLQGRLRLRSSFEREGIEVDYISYADGLARIRWRFGVRGEWRIGRLRPRQPIMPRPLHDELAKRSIALLLPRGTGDISILDLNDVLASVESKRVGAQIFKGSTKLGSGIQTIEKAKQTSLVALDADLKFNRVIRPVALRDGIDPEVRRYISIVALGNGVHWTRNDHNVLHTFVDHTYLVSDDVMIRYGQFVANLGARENQPVPEYFMRYFDGMTKFVADDFIVSEDDLSVIEPMEDRRSLITTLEAHIRGHNAI